MIGRGRVGEGVTVPDPVEAENKLDGFRHGVPGQAGGEVLEGSPRGAGQELNGPSHVHLGITVHEHMATPQLALPQGGAQ